MKFTHGYWQMRPGYKSFYAVQVHEGEIAAGALTVYAAAKKLTGRGDTLDTPLLTVRFTAPMENVIRVQAFHHKGGPPRRPEFALQADDAPSPVISENEHSFTLASGALSVCVPKAGDWLVQYKAGEQALTSSGWRGLGFEDTPDGRFIHEQLSLGVG